MVVRRRYAIKEEEEEERKISRIRIISSTEIIPVTAKQTSDLNCILAEKIPFTEFEERDSSREAVSLVRRMERKEEFF